ncbi:MULTISPECIES: winged helix-turn-helix transcriptional regulator [Sphingobacterium]|uniref:DNA-binding HxlR family transcriptional regulator n=2 Tax=Sphingobacterium TaxID=28453 RepID=A0ABU0U9H6_9SPHI|nr:MULTISPECIES: helix-turn-helix domain-containing protein [Sphingobacterium]MDQ1151507.1 DNA-binding HxlR family transcriptional regulator [Sphingobacterium zeae]MDR0262636.1 helix-turn-helix transcriptional regulator [Sphingobacterium sp.]
MKRTEFKSCSCAMQRSMAILGTRWKPVIIYTLRDRKARFGQLDALIENISRKVLTSSLKELEEDGVILREEYKELPPRVEYSLTEKGKALIPIMCQLAKWNESFYEEPELPELIA